MISSLLIQLLYMRGYVERTSCARKSVIKNALRNMSKDEYNKHVLQIQEWMKDEVKMEKTGYSIKGRYGI